MTQLSSIGIVLMLLGGSSPGFAGEQPHVFHGLVSQSLPRAADFTLTAHTGGPVHLSDFQGKLVWLCFGYTCCPGRCPTTLAEVAQAWQTLGAKAAEKTQVLMISVDPERDTPARLAAYLAHFNPSFLGLTGTPDEIATTAASDGIYYRNYEGTTTTSYVVDHTSMVIVVDEQGFVRLLFPFGMPAQAMADDLAAALASPLGIRLGWCSGAYAAFNPLIQLLRPISPIAWTPLAILWFGVCGLTRWRGGIVLAALPEMIVGMRVGLGVAWLVVVAAELIAIHAGRGFLILAARNAGNR
jgi:protein SCO1/2